MPFVLEQAYSTSMGWQNVHTFVTLLAPSADRWVLAAATVGLVLALVRRQRAMLIVTTLGVGSGIALVIDPQGKLYNTRFLPLWWLCAYLAAGYALGELGSIVAAYVRRVQLQYSLVGDEQWMRHPRPGPAQAFAAGGVSFAAPMAGAITPTFHAVTDTVAGARPGLPPAGEGGAGSGGTGPPSSWPPSRRRLRTRTPWVAGAVAVPILALAAAGTVVVPPLLVGPTGANLGPFHIGPSNVAGVGAVELLGVREQAGMARAARRHRRDDGPGDEDPWMWAGHVGVQLRPQPLRHPDGAHAPAVLHRWVRRLHGRACCSSPLPPRRGTS